MYLDYAPMEGITGAAYRRVHRAYFQGVDRYYSPFLSPTSDHRFTPREQREIFPEQNVGVPLIPQILTKNPEDFLWMAGELHAMGYGEVNLNLGCPSGTVTAKGKGSGMLSDLKALERFLDGIYEQAPCAISVKTRLGMEDPEEFGPILELYRRYPISELIIHPRVRKDFYRHPVRTVYFDRAMEQYDKPISYNGSVVTAADYTDYAKRYPAVKAIMIGQGLVSDPFLADRIKFSACSDRAKLQNFHDALFETYSELFGSRNNAAKRMKELWFYLIRLFAESEKYGKQILKSKHAEEYSLAVSAVFRDLELLEASRGGW